MDIIIFGLIIAVLLFLLPMILGVAFMGWQKKIKIKHQESGIEKIALWVTHGPILSLAFLYLFLGVKY